MARFSCSGTLLSAASRASRQNQISWGGGSRPSGGSPRIDSGTSPGPRGWSRQAGREANPLPGVTPRPLTTRSRTGKKETKFNAEEAKSLGDMRENEEPTNGSPSHPPPEGGPSRVAIQTPHEHYAVSSWHSFLATLRAARLGFWAGSPKKRSVEKLCIPEIQLNP